MIFLLVSILVPILTYLFLPTLLNQINPQGNPKQILLVLACTLFFVSWYLPSPEIQGEQTAAVTHFIGGGVFTGLIWLYVKTHLRWKAAWPLELVSLLAMVSLLGVANELFELFAVSVGIANLPLTDTSWDLLMNTLGALLVWVGYSLIVRNPPT